MGMPFFMVHFKPGQDFLDKGFLGRDGLMLIDDAHMDDLLNELRAVGLVISVRKNYYKEVPITILGGSHIVDTALFPVIKNGFSISLEGDIWLCRLPGPGQMIVEKQAADLPQAVQLVKTHFLQV